MFSCFRPWISCEYLTCSATNIFQSCSAAFQADARQQAGAGQAAAKRAVAALAGAGEASRQQAGLLLSASTHTQPAARTDPTVQHQQSSSRRSRSTAASLTPYCRLPAVMRVIHSDRISRFCSRTTHCEGVPVRARSRDCINSTATASPASAEGGARQDRFACRRIQQSSSGNRSGRHLHATACHRTAAATGGNRFAWHRRQSQRHRRQAWQAAGRAPNKKADVSHRAANSGVPHASTGASHASTQPAERRRRGYMAAHHQHPSRRSPWLSGHGRHTAGTSPPAPSPPGCSSWPAPGIPWPAGRQGAAGERGRGGRRQQAAAAAAAASGRSTQRRRGDGALSVLRIHRCIACGHREAQGSNRQRSKHACRTGGPPPRSPA